MSTVSGGAIYNWSTMTISNSTFTKNAATSLGGALCSNYGVFHLESGNVFAGNYTTGASSQGGVAYFQASGEITTITDNIFKWNGYSNYNPTTDTASTISTASGGVIANGAGTLIIKDSTFSNNAVTDSGGAVDNGDVLIIVSSTSVDTTAFINNRATNSGGAISSGGTLNIYRGVTFAVTIILQVVVLYIIMREQ